MSNIGKQLINIPSKLHLSILFFNNNYTLIFKGPLGILNLTLPPLFKFSIIDSNLSVSISNNNKAIWGTVKKLIENSIIGVTSGHTLNLQLIGIGYKVLFSNNNLQLFIGKSHPINISVPPTITIKCPNQSSIIGFSHSYNDLTTFFNKIYLIKPADKDHYKGKGITLNN